MGHSQSFQISPQDKQRPWDVHPIWRGFGCLMMLVIPVMAYAGATILIDLNTDLGWGFPVPVEMAKTVDINIPIPIPDVPDIQWSIPHFYGNLLLGAVLMFIGFGLLMLFYTLIYSMMGPSTRGPLDADPVRSRPPKPKKDWKDRTYRR
jgi:hypothetical protein